jgi:hypothetical protein
MFTTPFAVLGDTGAPLAWLVIARAGGILAFGMAYRLGTRLAGPAAGAIAAVALVLSDGFVFNFARGNSEGLLVALCLWGFERHLDGRRVDAFVLGLAAGLLRPEVWPFVAAYGLYLLWHDRSRRMVAIVGGGGALMLALWLVPEYIGSGDFLRAASRARQANPDSPAYATHPFLAVLDLSVPILSMPVYVGAILAVVAGLRRRDRVVITLAAATAVIMVVVAAMTQAGFAGNLRYVALPAALVCVLAGAGWVRLARAAGAWRGVLPLAAVTIAAAVYAAPYVRRDVRQLRVDAHTIRDEADYYGSVPEAIAAAGGVEHLKSCGPVYTGAFQTQTVAWYMHLSEDDVSIYAAAPGVVIAPIFEPLSRDPRFNTVVRTDRWVVRAVCDG